MGTDADTGTQNEPAGSQTTEAGTQNEAPSYRERDAADGRDAETPYCSGTPSDEDDPGDLSDLTDPFAEDDDEEEAAFAGRSSGPSQGVSRKWYD